MYDTPNNTVKHVDYLDGFQYAGEILQFFPTSEGYVSATPSQSSLGGGIDGYIYNYVYNYTDHLGNIRLSYTKDPVSNQLKIMEENHYYPFGLKHSTYAEPKQKYQLATTPTGEEIARPTYVYETDYMFKYNGKEFQDELGLNMYAMDMRQYDPAIARWVVQDPVTHFDYSPYNAFDNNPVFWADPSGADAMVSVGYDQEVASSDLMGSVQFSGTFDLAVGNEQKPNSGDGKSPIGSISASWTSEDEAQVPGDPNIQLSAVGIMKGNDSFNDNAMMGAANEALSIWENWETGVSITGSVISEGARNLNRAVDVRKGTYLTTSNSNLQNGKLRQVNVSTYKSVKVLGKASVIGGYAMTAASIYSDIQDGNYYTAGTRATVNLGIIGVGAVCPVCGFALSVGEAAFGDYLYNYVENNFDK